MDTSTNQMGGTSKAGKRFMVLQSRIFKMEMPDEKIKIPPKIEISVSSPPDRNSLSAPAPR